MWFVSCLKGNKSVFTFQKKRYIEHFGNAVAVPQPLERCLSRQAGIVRYCLQTCIIMTSNAGAQSIVEPKRLGFSQGEDKKKDYEDMKRGVMEEVRRIFKPEFLNRVDEILVFHMLDKQEIRQIVNILVKKLEKRCKEQLDIELVVRNSVKDYLAENGFDSKYGARPLKRAIQNKLEDRMAEEILDGKIHRGDRVIVSVSKKVIKFSVND